MSMNDLERDVCSLSAAWQQRMVDELTAWVAIPTGRGHATGLHGQRAALAHRLRQLGAVTRDITCERRPDWIDPPWESTHAADGVDILAAEHAGAGPRLLLSGHFDTVHDPHGSFRELRSIGGGRATGPGAADMKGGLVIALAALEAIRDAGHPLAWTFVLVPDEETGSYGSAAALRSLAPGHAAGFVFEPAGDGDSLIVERMGAAQFRIDAFGRAAHVGRDFAKGKALFTTVGCIACHKVGAEGVLWGPELTGVAAKYKGDPKAVLAEILEPSKNLEPRYRPIEFTLGNDDPFTGFLIKEEGETLTIQTGPGEAMVKKFAKKDLTSRASSSSIMPPGLLNLLNKEQILDLLAYLQAGGDAKHAAFGK